MSPLLLALSVQALAPVLSVVPPAACTIARAARVGFEEVHRDLARLRGRCIAVRGIGAGRALYQGEAASRIPGAEHAPATAPARIGLYGSRAIESGAIRPDAYIAVGLLGDCASFRQGEEVSGYCHGNSEGPFLIVTELRRRHWPSPRGLW